MCTYLFEFREVITEGLDFTTQGQILKLRQDSSKLQIQIDNIHKQMKTVRQKTMPDPVTLAKLRNQVKSLRVKILANSTQIKRMRGTK